MEDSQRDDQKSSLYKIVNNLIPSSIVKKKNQGKSWGYGYNEKYDVVVISKDGTIGDIYHISGINIAIPQRPQKTFSRSNKHAEQYWEAQEYPKELSKIKKVFQWNEMPSVFKSKWVDYIENEFDKRESGYWFYNNGTPTYITGSHYTYLQWTKIDVGLPDYRDANRIFFMF